MSTINAGSVARGDVVRVYGGQNGSNGIVESVKPNALGVDVKIRCSQTGQVYEYKLPASSKLEKVVSMTRK